MWQKTLRRVDARWLLAGFAAVLVAGVWSLTLLQLREVQRQQEEDALHDAVSLVRLFDEQASRTLDQADQAAVFLRRRYQALGGRLDLNGELRNGLGSNELYNLFTIVDAHADVVLSTRPFAPMNLGDREHIRVQMASTQDEPYLSRPVLGRVSKKWSLQLTRRIALADGGFGGAVVASVDPQFFTRLYNEVDVGRQGSIALVGADGVMRARRVGMDNSGGQDIGASAVFAAMRQNGRGTLLHAGPIDGRPRIYAYARLARYPLYVLVGIDQQEHQALAAASRAHALMLAGVVSAVILAFCGALYVLVGWLVSSRREAVAANLAKSRFLANMSHELRTPLNGILGYAELLQVEQGAAHRGEFAQAIHGCGLRLLGLIESVLELSALESGRGRLDIAMAPLDELLDQALAPHRARAAAKGVAVTLARAPALARALACDRAKVLRVLDILLKNAVEATGSGAVRLSVQPCGGGTLFQVSDTGAGVPPALLEVIFDRFRQADDAARRGKSGAGLGLAIAARLAGLMGGRVWAAPGQAQGALFCFQLPAQVQVLEADVPAGPAGAKKMTKMTKVATMAEVVR